MAKLHVLDINDPDVEGKPATCVLHTPTPGGVNAAGITWKDAFVAVGIAKPSVMSVGNKPGQITQAESNDIANGNVLEFVVLMDTKPQSRLGADADFIIGQQLILVQKRADLVGFTIT